MNKTSSSTPIAHDGKIVEQATQAATHVASTVVKQAREQIDTEFGTRKDKAVETMENVASAIRETGDKLKGVGPLGDVATRAADGLESVADFFETKKIGDVVRDVERFARREPALFLGAALAVGLVGGRFLKSSAHRESDGPPTERGQASSSSQNRGPAYGSYGALPKGPSSKASTGSPLSTLASGSSKPFAGASNSTGASSNSSSASAYGNLGSSTTPKNGFGNGNGNSGAV